MGLINQIPRFPFWELVSDRPYIVGNRKCCLFIWQALATPQDCHRDFRCHQELFEMVICNLFGNMLVMFMFVLIDAMLCAHWCISSTEVAGYRILTWRFTSILVLSTEFKYLLIIGSLQIMHTRLLKVCHQSQEFNIKQGKAKSCSVCICIWGLLQYTILDISHCAKPAPIWLVDYSEHL